MIEYPSAHADRLHNRCEVIVQENERGGFTGHVRSSTAHRNADVGRLQRRCVVHPVARHRNDLAIGFQSIHQPQLLLRDHPGKDVDRSHPPLELGVVDLVQIGAGDDFIDGREPRLTGDALRRGRMIAGNHDHPDACRVALLHGSGNSRAYWIGQADEAQERKREVVLLAR